MNKLMLFLASGLLMLSSVHAQDIHDLGTSEKAALLFMAQFYDRLGITEVTVTRCSPFQKIQFGDFTYLVAKEFITHHPGENQEVVGVVYDYAYPWTKTLSIPDFRLFMHYGNRALLREPNLDVNETAEEYDLERQRNQPVDQ
jgi:hypothetical protein